MARFCRCGAIVGKGGCRTCKPRSQAKTTTERGYGYDWQRLSERYKHEHPLCEDCEEKGKVVPMNEVHHVEPISEAPHKRLEWDNLRSLCSECHRERHR